MIVRALLSEARDLYEGFPVEEYPTDRQGWGSQHPVFQKAIEKWQPKLILEVGSWKGLSAIHMANVCAAQKLTTEIVCVDTWLGSPGLYTRENDPYRASLNPKFGYPQLYMTFAANVIASGHQDRLTPLALPSVLAAEVLRHFKVQADIVYIDAAHDQKSVCDDISAYWGLLTDSGVLIGDDYAWQGVKAAATEFAQKNNRTLLTDGEKYTICRRSDDRLQP